MHVFQKANSGTHLNCRYENCRDLYGIEHSRSTRSVNTLREPMYRRIAQEKGDRVPDLLSAEPNPQPAESPTI